MTELIPLRQILLEFQELTEEEEDLYFSAHCHFCGRRQSQMEFDTHENNCISLKALRGALPF